MFNAAKPAMRKMPRALTGMAIALAGNMAATAPANAQMVPQGIAAVAMMQVNCAKLKVGAPNAALAGAAQTSQAKSQAILGGTQSALDRIRQQQAAPEQALTPHAPAPQSLAPQAAAGIPISARLNCPAFALASAPILTPSLTPIPAPIPAIFQEPAAPENFLASPRIPIRVTSFSAEWERVSNDTISLEEVRSFVGDTGANDAKTLQSVNGWVNGEIAYAEDREIWNSRDYWALASQTLGQRAGDCEDVAILKYQMLRALGVAPEDMFLTLARDLARNADHAVLVVRLNGSFFLLDNSTDAILPANLSYDYRPTLSFSGGSSWLHGMVAAPSRQ